MIAVPQLQVQLGTHTHTLTLAHTHIFAVRVKCQTWRISRSNYKITASSRCCFFLSFFSTLVFRFHNDSTLSSVAKWQVASAMWQVASGCPENKKNPNETKNCHAVCLCALSWQKRDNSNDNNSAKVDQRALFPCSPPRSLCPVALFAVRAPKSTGTYESG